GRRQPSHSLRTALRRWPLPHESQVTGYNSLFFQRLPSWPSNPQLPQLFLQALAVQPNGRRGSRNIPAMLRQLLGQIGDLKLPLGFAEIRLSHSVIRLVGTVFHGNRFSLDHFRRQIVDSDLLLAAEH